MINIFMQTIEFFIFPKGWRKLITKKKHRTTAIQQPLYNSPMTTRAAVEESA
jgi:hypothetical protein